MNADNFRQNVLAAAREWLGTPWHHMARCKGAGVDCAQLLIAVYSDCGLMPAIDVGDYSADHMMHKNDEIFIGWILQYGHEVSAPELGDIIMYSVGRTYSHGGIAAPDDQVIHAYRPYGVVCETERHIGKLATRPQRFFSLF